MDCGRHHTVADFGPYVEANGVRQPTPRGFVWDSDLIQSPDHSAYSIGSHNAIGFGYQYHESPLLRRTERRIVFSDVGRRPVNPTFATFARLPPLFRRERTKAIAVSPHKAGVL